MYDWTQLVELPDSPRVTWENESQFLTRSYKCTHGEGKEYYPGQNAAGPDGYLRRFEVQSAPGYDVINMTWSPFLVTAGGVLTKQNRQTVYSMDQASIEKPIESHPDYIVGWNYKLYGEAGQPYPGEWADSATDQSDATGKDADGGSGYLWAKDYPGAGWFLMRVEDKPGVESYLLPSSVVTQESYYKKQSIAEDALKLVGYRGTPAQTLGVSGGEWLITHCSMVQSDVFWIVRIEWQHADSWDHDLYPNSY